MTGPGLSADLLLRRDESFELALDISIPPGRTTALLGPNGSGKSTAVAAIAGLLPIDTGEITLNDTVLDNPDRGVFVPVDQRRLGVVFQDYLLFPHLTVLENVAFGLRSRKISKDEASSRARQWLARLGLGGMGGSKPGDLSGGQAQRVALARALVIEPDLLLLDEPLAALDVTTRTELRQTLEEHLEAFPGPRLLITHDPTEAFILADDIHIIEAGSVTQSGTADEIRLRPRTPYAADLAGSNLVSGFAIAGDVETGTQTLRIADTGISGPVFLTIHPTAIAVYRHPPEGSPRNSWATNIERVEQLGMRVRLRTGAPLPLTIEVTDSARTDLGLAPGSPVWIAFKATEIGVQPGQ